MKKSSQSQEELKAIQEESQRQELPEQKRVFSVSEKIRRRVHNLPDPTRPPLGYDEHKAFDRVFPYVRLPRLHPPNHGDTVIFNAPDFPANQLILGDNLEVLRTLPPECIDLIYIDPPFFSGRTYNVIWGDTNEVRTFYDIWEGGIDSYLIWLNARLWEMWRVLKKTGSIYVHCDWHASHYIKSEMDKIFGYGRDHQNQIKPGFRNEIVWCYSGGGIPKSEYPRKHDVILWYTKSTAWIFNTIYRPYSEGTVQRGRTRVKGKYFKEGLRGEGTPITDWWDDLKKITSPTDFEKIGYPTQKSEALLERIIKASSNEGDVVADFFVGGGTTCAVAMKLNRRFIGCDSSRVAIAVTMDRLVKIGEEMSGVKSNISTGGVPVEESDFVLTCYGVSRNTGESVVHGFRPPGQSEPVLVGPSNPKESIDAYEVKTLFNEVKSRLEPNKPIRAKILGWRFDRRVQEYVKILRQYVEQNRLLVEDDGSPLIDIELIPLRSSRFRQRILQRYVNIEDADFFLRFPEPPVIGDIRVRKIGQLEYEFEAMDAFSTNEDGWLVNCQWDFDYQEGHFAAAKDYILSRTKVKSKVLGGGERFEAVLTAKYKFPKQGTYTVACKVQDNLAGESILSKTVRVDEK